MPVLSAQESILKSVRPDKIYGSSLLKVAEIFESVEASARVSDLAEEFQRRDDLMAVGVCGESGLALGLVTRVHLFSLLGKPFGRDILSRRTISEVVETTETFDMNTNLFQAAERLQPSMDRSQVQYYLLTDAEGSFRGVFSSKDLLAFLSRITQEDIRLAGQLQERLVKNRLSQGRRGPEPVGPGSGR